MSNSTERCNQERGVEISALAQSKILKHLRRNPNGLSVNEFDDFLHNMDEINANHKKNLRLLREKIRPLLFYRNGRIYANMHAKVPQYDAEFSRGQSHSLRSVESSTTSDIPSDESFKKKLTELIEKRPNGILLSNLREIFENEYGDSLDVKKLGFSNHLQFAIHYQSIFSITKTSVEGGDFLLRDAKKYPEYTKKAPEELKRQIVSIMEHYKVLYIEDLEKEYQKKYGKKLVAEDYNFLHIDDLIWHMKEIKFGVNSGRLVLYFDELSYKPEEQNQHRSLARNVTPSRVCGRGFVMKAQLLPQDYMLQVAIPIRISKIVTPSIYYIQLSEHYVRLQRLMLEMKECYNELEHLKRGENYTMKNEDLHAGMFCVCIHKNQWHRACIVSAHNPKRIKVKLVDYGTWDYVELKQIKYLFLNFANLPAQSICISEVGLSMHENIDNDVLYEIMKELSKRKLIIDLLEYTPLHNFNVKNEDPVLRCYILRECDSERISTIISRLVFNNHIPRETTVQHAWEVDHRQHNIVAPPTTFNGPNGLLNNFHNLERGESIHPIYISHSMPMHEPLYAEYQSVPSQSTPCSLSSPYMPNVPLRGPLEYFHHSHPEPTLEYMRPITTNNMMFQNQFRQDSHVEQQLSSFSGQHAPPSDGFLDYSRSYIRESINPENDRMLRLNSSRIPVETNNSPLSRHGYVGSSSNVQNYIEDEGTRLLNIGGTISMANEDLEDLYNGIPTVMSDKDVVDANSRPMNSPELLTQRSALLREPIVPASQSHRSLDHELNLNDVDTGLGSAELVRLTDERSGTLQSNLSAQNPCSSGMLDEMMALRISQDCPQIKTKELLRNLRNGVI